MMQNICWEESTPAGRAEAAVLAEGESGGLTELENSRNHENVVSVTLVAERICDFYGLLALGYKWTMFWNICTMFLVINLTPGRVLVNKECNMEFLGYL